MEKLISLEDTEHVIQNIQKSEISVLNDYINMWTKTVEELLGRLRDTIPGGGMIGEVHYWRDLSRVLDGITAELKQPQVELSVQILLSVND